ncbi:MAG: formate dehydrogenase accessory sulfurtransferase FdhD, partial [Stackebrandtia sp.]
MGRVSDRRRVLRIDPHGRRRRPDTLVVEEPLEIQLGGEPFSVTMRTPGDDVDLALGFLHSEDVVATNRDVAGAKHCVDSDLNVLDVSLRVPAPPPNRGFTVSSACGVCGVASIEALWTHLSGNVRHDLASDAAIVDVGLLLELPDRLRAAQKVFERTGGLHATGLFSPAGELLCVREDVGRHNAMDKVVGRALLDGALPLHGRILCVSGRLSFELVQ